jgi:hypothetical protein
MRNLFDILKEKFSEFYSPSEHLAVDEDIVEFKGHVIFRQYIPKKPKRFGIKIFKLCDETGYTYDVTVYLGRDRAHCATPDCNSRDSVRIDKENTRTWPQTLHGPLLLLPRFIR